jgi:RNA ligase (TIGR02306 family)
MSDFKIEVKKIFVKEHPNADKLEIGNIGHPDGHQVVVIKGKYKTGDLVVYIGENSVVPEWLLKKYGFWNVDKNKGMLAGTKGNRVKACKLRDAFSLGIVIPVEVSKELNFVRIDKSAGEVLLKVDEGNDIAEHLGVIKYCPPIPTCMAGQVYNAGREITLNFDIENIKKYPDLFAKDELVVCTSKLHGTFCQLIYIPFNSPYADDEHKLVEITVKDDLGKDISFKGYFAIASKGLGADGLCLKWNEENKNNIYIRAVSKYLEDVLTYICYSSLNIDKIIVIAGEVFGYGVQDLTYGAAQNELFFRAFDIYVGTRNDGAYMHDFVVDNMLELMKIERVPVLYRGPYNFEMINDMIQNSMETDFDENQIREGTVIKSQMERNTEIGRACAKLISEAYLLRKGNVTEFN